MTMIAGNIARASRKAGLVLTLLLCVWGSACRADVVLETTFDWSEAKSLDPAVLLATVQTNQPRPLSIHVLRIDVADPQIALRSTGRTEDYEANERETSKQRTRSFLSQSLDAGYEMIAAVNASPWSPWPPPQPDHGYANLRSLAVADGEVVSPLDTDNPRPALVVWKDGRTEILIPSEEDVSEIQEAVSGFQIVLEEGRTTGSDTKLAPRTGYGLCSEGRYLFWLIADGRQEGFSEGLARQEVGEWLRFFGAESGINMDGGGSSTLAIVSPDTLEVEVINSFSDRVGGLVPFERHVGNNLGVYRSSEAP